MSSTISADVVSKPRGPRISDTEAGDHKGPFNPSTTNPLRKRTTGHTLNSPRNMETNTRQEFSRELGLRGSRIPSGAIRSLAFRATALKQAALSDPRHKAFWTLRFALDSASVK